MPKEERKMNDAKIIKSIDELGRLGIPKHVRRALGVQTGEQVELILDNDTLIIKKSNEGCHFCDGNERLTYFRGTCICADCIALLTNS